MFRSNDALPLTASHLGAVERIGWVDYARGICIVGVVFGHAIGGLDAAGILGAHGPHSYILKVMYAFRMPTLFFIAGLFLANSVRRPAGRFLADRAAVLLYPYVLWTVIHAASREVVWDYTNKVIGLRAILTNLPFRPFGEMWFLFALFIVSSIIWGLDRLRVRPLGIFAVAAALHGLQFMLPEALRPTLAPTCHFALYSAIGFSIARNRGSVSSLQLPVTGAGIASLGCAIVVATLVIFVSHESPFALLITLPGIVMVVGASRVIDAMGVAPWLRALGARSLQIYLAHPLGTAGARILLKHVFKVQSPLVYVVVCTALGLLVPVLLDWAARKTGTEWIFSLRPLLRTKPGSSQQAAARPSAQAIGRHASNVPTGGGFPGGAAGAVSIVGGD